MLPLPFRLLPFTAKTLVISSPPGPMITVGRASYLFLIGDSLITIDGPLKARPYEK